MDRARFRRIFFRIAFGVLVALVVLLALGAYLVRSDPSWYRQLKLTDEESAAAERRLLDRLAILRNDIGRIEATARQTASPVEWPTFEFELTEDEVNGPLARWTQGGPVAQWAESNPEVAKVLTEIQEPHVRFLKGRIEIAGRSTSLGSLVSIEVSVQQPTRPGEFPTVVLGRPWAGRMPLSRSIIEEPTIRGIETLRKQPESSVPHAVIDSAEQLVRGEQTTPIVVLDSSTSGSGLLAARVEELEVTDGLLKATLRPIPPGTQVRPQNLP